jgi:glycosyltransferase involved in cell wall biosynthesis
MKLLITLSLFITITSVSAKDFDQVGEINRILKLKKPVIIHRALLELKDKNQHFKIKLMKQKSYKPDKFHYTITLENLLKHIPFNLKNINSCQGLYEVLKDEHKSTWAELEAPTHHIWPAFNQICSGAKSI